MVSKQRVILPQYGVPGGAGGVQVNDALVAGANIAGFEKIASAMMSQGVV